MHTVSTAPTPLPPRADIVVIGGGITGVSLAAELAESARVVLLEAEQSLFHHTSSRSAQQVQPSYGPAPVRALTTTTLGLLRRWEEETGTSLLSPRPLYWLQLRGSTTDVASLRARIPALRRSSGEEARAAFPALRPGAVAAAAVDDEAQEVRVDLLLRLYADRARRAGALLATGAAVEGVDRVRADLRVRTSRGTVTAPVVVNAAGAWADAVATLAGARPRGLVPTRRSVVVARAEGRPVSPSWPMLCDAGGSFYLRPRGTDVLLSPLEDEPSAAEDARPRPEIVAAALARVNEVIDSELTTVRERWTGLRTLSPDDVPVVGEDGDVAGFYWLAGQGGYGIQTSAAIARSAAADILGRSVDPRSETAKAFRALDPQRPELRAEVSA